MQRTTQILSEVLETNLTAYANKPVHLHDTKFLLRLNETFKNSSFYYRIMDALDRDIGEIFNIIFLTHEEFIVMAINNRRSPSELEYQMINTNLRRYIDQSQTHKVEIINQAKTILATVRELLSENNPKQSLVVRLDSFERMLDDLYVLIFMMTLSLTIPGESPMLN